jgi:hypothetical protein
MSCEVALTARSLVVHDLCTMARTPPNPIRAYKVREDLTYSQLAERLGISEDYARKLGSDGRTSVSPHMARQFEDRTTGGIRYAAVMRWIDWHQRQTAA